VGLGLEKIPPPIGGGILVELLYFYNNLAKLCIRH